MNNSTDILDDPEMQKMVQSGVNKTSNASATGDLTQLCNFGSIQESKVIGGFTFVVKTLSSGEQERALSNVAKYNIASLVVAAALQNQILARSVVSVNGIPLENVPFNRGSVGDDNVLAQLDRDRDNLEAKRLAVVLSWQDGLRQQLFQFHQDLSVKSENIINGVDAADLKG